MNWRKSYQREKELSERETKYQNQTDMAKNIIETSYGQIVEIINGTLVCRLTHANMKTIADWLDVEDEIPATLKIIGHVINVDFPESVSTSKLESLLEHFTYQK